VVIRATPSTPVLVGRQQVTWLRTELGRRGVPVNRASRPWVWIVRDPDGYERSFETKAEAVSYIEEWVAA
jgi:hypothetical protein